MSFNPFANLDGGPFKDGVLDTFFVLVPSVLVLAETLSLFPGFSVRLRFRLDTRNMIDLNN
jgi:hypothetical protein